MKYYIIGADNHQYGPVDEDVLIQWVNEGRIVDSTILVEDVTSIRYPAEQLPILRPYLKSTMVPAPPQAYILPSNKKSKVAAGILGIVLGSLGIHRFYLGYTGIGIAMLLITVLSCGYLSIITYIWGFIEGIMCLIGSMTDSDGRPLGD